MLSLTFPVLLVNPQGFLCRDYVSYKNIPFGLKNSCFSKTYFLYLWLIFFMGDKFWGPKFDLGSELCFGQKPIFVVFFLKQLNCTDNRFPRMVNHGKI